MHEGPETPSPRTRIGRRAALAALVAAFLLPLAAAPAAAADKVLRIGVQKYGTLIILRERHTLEQALKSLGWSVSWAEFPGGPQLLEALNKGSNVHYLLVRALESAGLKPGDIQTVYLAPADGRAAFDRGAVDAWVIWNPFLAVAEQATQARVLADATGLAPNRQFFLGSRALVQQHPEIVKLVNDQIAATDRWAEQHQPEAAAMLSATMGVPQPVLAQALARMGYGAAPLTPEVTADQQKIAEMFHALGLIPSPITVSDAVWHPGS